MKKAFLNLKIIFSLKLKVAHIVDIPCLLSCCSPFKKLLFVWGQMSEIEELNVNLNRKNAELHSSLEVQASNYKAQVLLICSIIYEGNFL